VPASLPSSVFANLCVYSTCRYRFPTLSPRWPATPRLEIAAWRLPSYQHPYSSMGSTRSNASGTFVRRSTLYIGSAPSP
jgi:hypothetical protein